MFFNHWRNSTEVGPQEVYQQNSFNIPGFNRPNRQMKLRQNRPPGGFAGTIGEPNATLLNDNPMLPGAKIRVMNTTRLGPGWTNQII
jgi:hypothetical protein